MTYNKIVCDVLWLLLAAEVREKVRVVCTSNRTSDIMSRIQFANWRHVVSL